MFSILWNRFADIDCFPLSSFGDHSSSSHSLFLSPNTFPHFFLLLQWTNNNISTTTTTTTTLLEREIGLHYSWDLTTLLTVQSRVTTTLFLYFISSFSSPKRCFTTLPRLTRVNCNIWWQKLCEKYLWGPWERPGGGRGGACGGENEPITLSNNWSLIVMESSVEPCCQMIVCTYKNAH